MDIKRKLQSKYLKNSKHSGYQILPSRLGKIINERGLKIKTRYEPERLKYILEKTQIKGKSVLDIGGNTGYFVFELLDEGAENVDYIEGNKEHAEFVELTSRLLNLEKKVKVDSKYFDFSGSFKNKYDVALLLNVLHHFGSDYGNKDISIVEAKKKILKQLNSLRNNTKILIFQMGFNWKGDVKKCLFDHGLKKEMINYIEDGTKENWEILSIGIAELTARGVKYFDLNKKNIQRNDKLGEFLNRPLFILKSKEDKL